MHRNYSDDFFSLHYCTRSLRVVHIIAPLCNRYSSLFVTGSIHLSDRILNLLFHHSIRHSVLHVQTAWHIMKTQLQSLKCITEELPCMAGRWSTTGTLAPGASRTLPLHSGTRGCRHTCATLVLHSRVHSRYSHAKFTRTIQNTLLAHAYTLAYHPKCILCTSSCTLTQSFIRLKEHSYSNLMLT